MWINDTREGLAAELRILREQPLDRAVEERLQGRGGRRLRERADDDRFAPLRLIGDRDRADARSHCAKEEGNQRGAEGGECATSAPGHGASLGSIVSGPVAFDKS